MATTIAKLARRADAGIVGTQTPETDRWRFEREAFEAGWFRVAGVDEAGRGPLAGPVTAAAVVLPSDWPRDGLPERLLGLDDSKQLTAAQRERFFEALTVDKCVDWAVAEVSPAEIDRLNILRASHRAMAEALGALRAPPDHALVDGLPANGLPVSPTFIVRGDTLSFSIAAASVLAKVTRDRRMMDADRKWPQYGFGRHKGYPTAAHLSALARYGPSPIHRRSYRPVAQLELPWAD